MGEEADTGSLAGRKTYCRSSSWAASRSSATELCAAVGDTASEKSSANGLQRRCPIPPLTPRSQNCKARSSLPPLQPLSIARRSYNEWPKAGSDDVGEWPQPPTPGGRVLGPTTNPSEGLKLDLSSIQSGVKKDQIAFFDKECSKVADHIYLGGDSVARNREILRQNGITHVLNCVGFVCPEYFKSDLVYKTLWLQDSPTEDITSILYDVFDYFEDVRDQEGRVFVHCCQGVSRSTSLVIAYLMWREGQSFDDALELVKTARSIANPNVGFAGQLLQCQKRVHAIPLSPNSVLRMYRMAPHSSYDPLHLVPKMLNEPSPAALDSRGAFIVHVLSSIYIWIGKECKPVMEKDAKAAAFQVVRYEKVRGAIVTVVDGLEPTEFWEAFSSSPGSSENDVMVSKEHVSSVIKIASGKRRVESYNVDFELFHKAITGGVVPPFSSSGPGQETHLPARESNWSILRRKFMSGTISRVYSSPVIVKDVDSHVNRVQLLSMESLASPPFPSPSSLSSDSSNSSKGSSESPFGSPSTSFSSSLTPSPASTNYHDSLFPPSRDPLCFKSSPEPLKPCLEDVCSPSKGPARSIAERRASFSPLKLPALTKDASLLPKSSGNPPSVHNLLEADASEITSRTRHDSDFKCADRCDITCFINGTERSSAYSPDGLLLTGSAGQIDVSSSNSHSFQPLVYRWPSMETLTTLYREDLNSSALLLLLTSSIGRGRDLDRRLFLWVGSCFEQNKLDSGSEVDDVKEIKWCGVGSEFLSSMGLPNDIPFKVVKGEKPEKFLHLISSFP